MAVQHVEARSRTSAAAIVRAFETAAKASEYGRADDPHTLHKYLQAKERLIHHLVWVTFYGHKKIELESE